MEDKVSVDEFAHFEERSSKFSVSKDDLQYLLTNKVSIEELRTLLDGKVDVNELSQHMNR